jgi:hypothetical protein
MLFSKSLALAVALLASSVVASHNDIHAPAVARHAGSKREYLRSVGVSFSHASGGIAGPCCGV